MNIHTKSLLLGFGLACLLLSGAVAAFIFVGDREFQQTVREQHLASGKTAKVTLCTLAWGVEHKERRERDDSFKLEYVSSAAHTDLAALDRETLEVFELIRPVSEQWGFKNASVSAFPTTRRKGKYFAYLFARERGGQWTYKRNPAKVFIND